MSASNASSTPSASRSSSRLALSIEASGRENSTTSLASPRRTQGTLTPTARKQALREFYKLNKHKSTSSGTDLDKENFDGKDYVDKLVKEKNLTSLITMENDLVQGFSKSLHAHDRYSQLGWGEKVSCV
jgi:hypothetical protein